MIVNSKENTLRRIPLIISALRVNEGGHIDLSIETHRGVDTQRSTMG